MDITHGVNKHSGEQYLSFHFNEHPLCTRYRVHMLNDTTFKLTPHPKGWKVAEKILQVSDLFRIGMEAEKPTVRPRYKYRDVVWTTHEGLYTAYLDGPWKKIPGHHPEIPGRRIQHGSGRTSSYGPVDRTRQVVLSGVHVGELLYRATEVPHPEKQILKLQDEALEQLETSIPEDFLFEHVTRMFQKYRCVRHETGTLGLLCGVHFKVVPLEQALKDNIVFGEVPPEIPVYKMGIEVVMLDGKTNIWWGRFKAVPMGVYLGRKYTREV